jgi:hypothetical protein
MPLTKQELISALENEVRLILHLASKAEPAAVGYRPTPTQRTTLELLQYLAIMAPIHLRAVMAPAFDMDAWRNAWTTGEAAARAMTLEDAVEAIGRQAAMFRDELGAAGDDALHAPIEMFGSTASRAAMLVNLVLCHYSAYRMQLFLYLKSSGREELNTLNLWVGRDKL